jgi:uncharacterized low-complexity protein
MRFDKKFVSTALCTAVAAAALSAPVFAAHALSSGYQQTVAGDNKDAEHKCGEAKCGGEKDAEHKCGGDKSAEHKCGEAKCGGDAKADAEHKCGADAKKTSEHKCGSHPG